MPYDRDETPRNEINAASTCVPSRPLNQGTPLSAGQGSPGGTSCPSPVGPPRPARPCQWTTRQVGLPGAGRGSAAKRPLARRGTPPAAHAQRGLSRRRRDEVVPDAGLRFSALRFSALRTPPRKAMVHCSIANGTHAMQRQKKRTLGAGQRPPGRPGAPFPPLLTSLRRVFSLGLLRPRTRRPRSLRRSLRRVGEQKTLGFIRNPRINILIPTPAVPKPLRITQIGTNANGEIEIKTFPGGC